MFIHSKRTCAVGSALPSSDEGHAAPPALEPSRDVLFHSPVALPPLDPFLIVLVAPTHSPPAADARPALLDPSGSQPRLPRRLYTRCLAGSHELLPGISSIAATVPPQQPRSSHPPGIRSSCREISPLFDSHRKQNFGAPSQADPLPGFLKQAIAEDDADLLLICLWIKFFLMATKYICCLGKLIAHELFTSSQNLSTEGQGAKTR
ncbi:hypothetical protein EJB05_49398 [Eragrostis curvula]|uniref:Uncharacterized protein n=1 Tax=Eragrostis curvula TaxID=38414 RepID=A0A5J9T5C9_9POAL|nr:hypothetical protein EJB05_49398 [Eragrostis curvula]